MLGIWQISKSWKSASGSRNLPVACSIYYTSLHVFSNESAVATIKIWLLQLARSQTKAILGKCLKALKTCVEKPIIEILILLTKAKQKKPSILYCLCTVFFSWMLYIYKLFRLVSYDHFVSHNFLLSFSFLSSLFPIKTLWLIIMSMTSRMCKKELHLMLSSAQCKWFNNSSLVLFVFTLLFFLI